jgi:hypothetical protein
MAQMMEDEDLGGDNERAKDLSGHKRRKGNAETSSTRQGKPLFSTAIILDNSPLVKSCRQDTSKGSTMCSQ